MAGLGRVTSFSWSGQTRVHVYLGSQLCGGMSFLRRTRQPGSWRLTNRSGKLNRPRMFSARQATDAIVMTPHMTIWSEHGSPPIGNAPR
jgi:hypothetical protein